MARDARRACRRRHAQDARTMRIAGEDDDIEDDQRAETNVRIDSGSESDGAHRDSAHAQT